MKKAVIFDMDGVIIQSEMLYQKRRNIFFEAHGIIVDDTFQRNVIGSNPVDMFAMIFPKSKDKQKEYLDKYNEFKTDYHIEFKEILTDDIEQTLRWLKENNYRFALASSGEYPILMRILEETMLAPYFEVVVSGADMPKSKPAPDVYLEAVKQLGLSPSECVAVEDSKHGIQASVSAGLDCLALKPNNYEVDQQLATQIINSLNDIPTWLSL
ncbi:HAD family hydrolase [Vagococcus fluvialis]|uniref:HAD family hydrolase n=1 Tax=Vagococcus fluvialis TaxID=2738 RepID=UPI003B5A4889